MRLRRKKAWDGKKFHEPVRGAVFGLICFAAERQVDIALKVTPLPNNKPRPHFFYLKLITSYSVTMYFIAVITHHYTRINMMEARVDPLIYLTYQQSDLVDHIVILVGAVITSVPEAYHRSLGLTRCMSVSLSLKIISFEFNRCGIIINK